MNLSSLFAPIERLIEEHGSSAIQGKHIAFLREQLSILKEKSLESDRENSTLKARVKELEAENADLRKQLEYAKPTGFLEHEGLLWKRSASGFEPRPYCPVCQKHPVMSEFPPHEKLMWCCPANHTFDYVSSPPPKT